MDAPPPPAPPARPTLQATPAMIAVAWDTWYARHRGRLGPGPAFREAIEAALAHPDARQLVLGAEQGKE